MPMAVNSPTRFAGAPSGREPWGAGKNRLSGNEFPRVWAKGSLSEG